MNVGELEDLRVLCCTPGDCRSGGDRNSYFFVGTFFTQNNSECAHGDIVGDRRRRRVWDVRQNVRSSRRLRVLPTSRLWC